MKPSPLRRAACAAVGALLLAGCEPSLSAMTTPPPGRVAELDAEADLVTVSRGVALAVECRDQEGPCADLEVTSDDDEIALVRPAFRAELSSSVSGPRAASAFVIVGRAPGATRVRVSTLGSSLDLDVEVVAP